MKSHNYSQFANYLDFVSSKYNLQICIKDFVGFISVDKDLDNSLRPFLAHTNPYCMYVKSDKAVYSKCISMMKPMAIKCSRLNKAFYGVCHGGVGEYVLPIEIDGELLGAINAGVFHQDEKLVKHLIKKMCKNSDTINEETTYKFYEDFITSTKYDEETIVNILGIVAEYLANTYINLKSTHVDLKLGKKRYNSSEDTILAHALEYIRQNYLQQVTVANIAEFCHCCESYINHIIKKRLGVNINTYINKLRVEHAKYYLVSSGDSVADIALKVGFGDPNYFSRVFSTLMGITPTEFRRRYS